MAAETGTKATATGRRPSMFRRIYVYCWSAKGQNASYQDAAVELRKELVNRLSKPKSMLIDR